MGFGVPLASWFRGPLKEQVRTALLGETMADCRLFDQQYLTKVVSQHQSGLRDYSTTIWSLLMFNSFLDNSH